MRNYNFYVYIITNYSKTVLYIGVTNNLNARLIQHFENKGDTQTFAGRYSCHHLIYYEYFTYIQHAIGREKEIKKWSRKKKEALIATTNPNWLFLTDELGL
jgi:putative endonuclease